MDDMVRRSDESTTQGRSTSAQAVRRRPILVAVSASSDTVPAGPFAAWLATMTIALDGGDGTDVACGTCTACCRSHQFVLIEPDETDTIAHLPAELLFPAPRSPGYLLLGYDQHGQCPMLSTDGCSVYEHRPRTCRTYDCRVFPAAGLVADQPAVAERAARWQFDHPTPHDHAAHAAVRAAASFVADHPDVLPNGAPPPGSTPHAVLAVRLSDLFVDAVPTPQAVAVEVRGRLNRR